MPYLMAQVGGRILDRRGAKPAVEGGSALAGDGFFRLCWQADRLSLVLSSSRSRLPAAGSA